MTDRLALYKQKRLAFPPSIFLFIKIKKAFLNQFNNEIQDIVNYLNKKLKFVTRNNKLF